MKDPSSEIPYEEKEIRCPKLGGPVNFAYCRIESSKRPCSRALGCWEPHFDVEAHFRTLMSEEEYEECFCQSPPSRVSTLIELIEKAKKIAEEKNRQSDSSLDDAGREDR